MRAERLLSTLIAFILIFGCISTYADAVSQTEIDAIKEQRDAVASERAAQQQVIDEYAVERDRIIDEKLVLEQSVTLAAEQIALYDLEIEAYSELIEQKQLDVDAAKYNEDIQFSRYCTRIRAMEENGNYNILALILNAESFSSLLSSLDDYGDVMDADKKLYDDLQEARLEHQRIKEEYEAYKAECEELQEQLRIEKAAMEADIAAKQARIEEIQEEINNNQDLLNQLNSKWYELNNEISSMEAQMAAQNAAPGSLTGYGFVWPVGTNYITSRAGNRYHPVTGEYKYHSGMDAGASSGSAVWAAADGTVSYAGWKGGYGNCVMILHGNGLETLYGHLSSFCVSVNQSVSSGQTIGYVGSTGLSTGPHLHFEIRSGGACMDPENYFPSGSFTFSSSAGE